MCDAVVGDSRPEKVSDTNSVLAVASMMTKPLPVPGEIVPSVAPFKVATYVMGAATAVAPRQRAPKTSRESFIVSSKNTLQSSILPAAEFQAGARYYGLTQTRAASKEFGPLTVIVRLDVTRVPSHGGVPAGIGGT